MANIYELALALRVVGVLIFATVAAYLVGSLTVQLFMALLARLPVPSEARVVFLRRVDSSGQAPSFANYRGESTIPYVKTGQLPPELHAMDRFANDFGRLCAEAEFRWTAPVPLVLLGGYLAFSQSWWWAFPIVVVVVLMRDGRKRFLLACEQLHRAAAAQADQLHAEAAQAWDTAAGH
jgi:hypothetical protein